MNYKELYIPSVIKEIEQNHRGYIQEVDTSEYEQLSKREFVKRYLIRLDDDDYLNDVMKSTFYRHTKGELRAIAYWISSYFNLFELGSNILFTVAVQEGLKMIKSYGWNYSAQVLLIKDVMLRYYTEGFSDYTDEQLNYYITLLDEEFERLNQPPKNVSSKNIKFRQKVMRENVQRQKFVVLQIWSEEKEKWIMVGSVNSDARDDELGKNYTEIKFP